jgi:electron transfer flavoprotein alpha subunit
MKALVFISSNHFASKASKEAVTYAKKMGGDVTVVSFGSIDGAASLGIFGANKVLVDTSIEVADEQQLTRLVASAF